MEFKWIVSSSFVPPCSFLYVTSKKRMGGEVTNSLVMNVCANYKLDKYTMDRIEKQNTSKPLLANRKAERNINVPLSYKITFNLNIPLFIKYTYLRVHLQGYH